MFANAFFDNVSIANQYWIFRPGSSSDIQNGNLNNAHFSHATGRTSFGPTTNPHPYLTDGTPENSFEITDIQENGGELTFHVHFFDDGIEDHHADGMLSDDRLAVHPNPTTDKLFVEGRDLQRVELFNTVGQCVLTQVTENLDATEISLADLPTGIYLLRVVMDGGSVSVQKVVKAGR